MFLKSYCVKKKKKKILILKQIEIYAQADTNALRITCSPFNTLTIFVASLWVHKQLD